MNPLEELDVTNKLLEERNRLLNAIPECPEHGAQCVPHGIEYLDWEHDEEHRGYVLWNKNRHMDVCSPKAVRELALLRPNILFVSTFAPKDSPQNLKTIGLQPHDKMKTVIQRSMVYLSTTKETFGIGTLEAMAAGIPVLGFAYGGNLDLVEHG
ncbi:hypothetical protein LCGC14_2854040, partial [marine sediment metagenome]